MRRRSFNLLTALSLLLCVAACVLWVRSHRVNSVFGYYSDASGDGWYRNTYFSSQAGRLTFVSLHQKFDDGLPRGGLHAREGPIRSIRPRAEFAGFSHFSAEGREMGWTEIRVPYWFTVLVTAIAPLLSVVPWLRARRDRKAGLCRRCGYDLRATPDRCPECGQVRSPGRDGANRVGVG